MTQTVQPRSAIAHEDTWNVESVFSSEAAWQAEMERISAELPSLTRFRDQLGSSPATLADWLDTSAEIQRAANKVWLYARMGFTVDTGDQRAVARNEEATAFYTGVQSAMSFAEPEILAIGYDRLQQWLRDEPRLARYDHWFDRLWQRQAHVRSAEIEELLSQVNDPFTSAARIHGTLTDADLQFTPAHSSDGATIDVAQGNLAALLTSPDRPTRRTAWESYADAHLAAKNTMANCLATGVKQHVFTARARRYDSCLEAALKPNFIPVEVFHNLLDTFRRHLPTWHRYWRIRRQALGYDSLHVYDIKAPLTRGKLEVPFGQAYEWIENGMQPLGDEYIQPMRRGVLEQRWVDKYPNKGKRMGAFSSGAPGTYPFILMSYNDDLFSMSTLAHEIGHSMHSYFSWQNQPLAYARYGLFVAETASNFNQALVRAHLLETTADPDFQIGVIEEAMSNFHRYFFIMPTLARFELEIHQRGERGQGLTADGLIALMTELFAEGYGSEVAIDHDRVGSTWMQFSTHLYSNFYVYQYATGISAAHALAEGVLDQSSDAAQRYLDFLKAGGSLYPLDALKLAGVDMTSPEPVEQTFGVLARYVDRLEQLLKDRGKS
jgi:oligoendopeptidase F